MSEEPEFDRRARTQAIAAEYIERGDPLGWFDALYRESGGDLKLIPWADMEPNRFFRRWAEESGLKGDGRTALWSAAGLATTLNICMIWVKGHGIRYFADRGRVGEKAISGHRYRL